MLSVNVVKRRAEKARGLRLAARNVATATSTYGRGVRSRFQKCFTQITDRF